MFKQRAGNFFYFQFERIKRMHLFYIQWKLIPSYSASKRYRFFSFACFHPRYKKISGCICQTSTNIPVRAFCEQIRKIVRCMASYCIIRLRSCFSLTISLTVIHLWFLIKMVADVLETILAVCLQYLAPEKNILLTMMGAGPLKVLSILKGV